MSSIMTNTSAMTALRTLNMTNKNLELTQARISTGYEVKEAADNAAYWSIATTMRSENKAMTTVNDALGLGKATVDVAYTALDTAKDVLDEIKTKLVAAKQPGIDKAKVQAEITQLQDQLEGIASAASFSGSNWLSVDSSDANYEEIQQVVSSFSRTNNGTLSIGVIDIDISGVSLFNAGADSGSGTTLQGIGLLEKGLGSTATGGLAATGTTGATATSGADVAATAGGYTTTGFSLAGLAATDKIVFDAAVNGTNVTGVEVTVGSNIDDFIANFNANADLNGVTASKVGAEVRFTSQLTGTTSNFTISNVSYEQADGSAVSGTPDANVDGTGTAGVNATAVGGTQGSAAMAVSFGSAITLDDDDTISFDISLNGGAATTITVDKAVVDAALNVNDGTISSAVEMATVLNNVFTSTAVGASANGSSGSIVITSNLEGAASSVSIANVQASNGGLSFGVMEIDITNASSAQLDEYINGVDTMAEKVTTAASNLGAVKSRIDMQQDFVSSLMDAIDRGVGQLVDADMSKESTRLQALQVQQQLGVQALSIANGSAQTILALFSR